MQGVDTSTVMTSTQTQEPKPLRALEFYSGLGGWAYSLREAQTRLDNKEAQVVAAWDISPVANHVYAHNHGRDPSPSSIETLDAKTLDRWGADLWMLSPPCQPHTRNNTTDKRDVQDPRSSSFLRLTEALALMASPPTFIALENVKGFEESESCRHWLACLETRGYQVMQFLLSPTQIGCPNDRPRYFCLAHRLGLQHPPPSSALVTHPPWEEGSSPPPCAPLQSYLEDIGVEDETWRVPDSVIAKGSAWCFDIVTRTTDRSACFTKSYTRYVRGTGSVLYYTVPDPGGGDANDDMNPVLALASPEEREFDENWRERLKLHTTGRLRYFSPREVANLLHFPKDFIFPPDVPVRKQYELLGNSIHVGLSSRLLEWLLSRPPS